MKALGVALVASMLLSGPAAFAKPKTAKAAPTATPHPKMWLMSFTVTMTDFASHRQTSDGAVTGISQPACGNISGALDLGDRKNYVWKQKGLYCSSSDTYYVTFRAGKYDHNLVDVTADDVRDIFGADAVTDVKEIPYEEFQRQLQAKERVQIIEALKLSGGNVPQAAVRIGMKEADLQKKIALYGISAGKQ